MKPVTFTIKSPKSEMDIRVLRWAIVEQLKQAGYETKEILPIFDQLNRCTVKDFLTVLALYGTVQLND